MAQLKLGTLIGGNTAWHSGNDGAESGLDADLLDGQQGSYYQPALGYTPVNKAGDSMSGALSIDNGTLTASSPAISLSQTWNNATTVFTGIKLNVTDTASNASSLLLDLQVGGSSKVKLSKSNVLTVGNSITLTNGQITNVHPLVISMGNGNAGVKYNTTGIGWIEFPVGGDNYGRGSITNFGGLHWSVAGNIGFLASAPALFSFGGDANAWSASNVRSGLLVYPNDTHSKPVIGSWDGTNMRFAVTSDGSLSWYSDTYISRESANTLSQRNATNAQTLRVYNTYTDASNYERAKIGWNTNVLEIGTEAAGTGTTRNINLIGGNVGVGASSPAAKLQVEGSLRFASDGAGAEYLEFLRTASNTWKFTSSSVGEIFRVVGNSISFYQDTFIERGGLTVGPTLASATSALRVNHTWNNSGNVFTLIRGNATDTASSANSLLIDLQVGAVSKFKVDKTGVVTHNGLSPTDGLEIDQIKAISKSLTLTTDWQDTGISGTDLATGTYIIQLFANDAPGGGTNNNEYYSGTMSWYSGSTNSSTAMPTDEIPLHRAGGSGEGELYLRTYRTPGGVLKLQVFANVANASASNYMFKFRRMI